MLIHIAKGSNKEQTLSIYKKQQQEPKKNGHPLIHHGKQALMWT
jgi:hypothetical protein